MLRNHDHREPSTVSEWELGVAAMLLLLVVVLAALVVPILA